MKAPRIAGTYARIVAATMAAPRSSSSYGSGRGGEMGAARVGLGSGREGDSRDRVRRRRSLRAIEPTVLSTAEDRSATRPAAAHRPGSFERRRYPLVTRRVVHNGA